MSAMPSQVDHNNPAPTSDFVLVFFSNFDTNGVSNRELCEVVSDSDLELILGNIT